VIGGGGVESSNEQADYDFKNWLLLDVPLLTSEERKLAFHLLEEENQILRQKLNVLKIEKSVLSKIRFCIKFGKQTAALILMKN
jgi:hypothetical protein